MEINRGYCTTPDGRSSKTFKFDNTRAGMDTLWGMIMANKNRFKCNEVIVGYESTGPYGEPMLHYLMKKPVRIVQVNPMHTKRVKEINDNSPLKTDEKDPRVIADRRQWRAEGSSCCTPWLGVLIHVVLAFITKH